MSSTTTEQRASGLFSTRQANTLLLVAGCLYLVQGIPVGLAMQALPALMRDADVPLALISLTPLAGLPWVGKFLFATWVDNYSSERLGRRRTWILPMQSILILCLITMAFLPFSIEWALWLVGLVALASLASAIQDIATDGLAADYLHGGSLVNSNAFQVIGFMGGMLIGGPLVMMLMDRFGQLLSMLVLAAVVGLSLVMLLFWNEKRMQALLPRTHRDPSGRRRAAFSRFFTRESAIKYLVIGVTSTMGGAAVFALVKLILLDNGWDLTEVGTITAVGNASTVLVGGFLAIWFLQRWSLLSMWLTGLAAVLTAAVSWWQLLSADWSTDLSVWVWTTIVIGGFGIGMTTVAVYTFLMRFTRQGKQVATDYAIYQSGLVGGEIFFSSAAVGIASAYGYSAALWVTAAVVGLILATVFWQRATMNEVLAKDQA